MSDPGALPLYVQTAELLIRDIQSGRLLDGERLPPEREMAKGLGIAVGTLRKALEELDAKGLLDRRQGSGNYVRAARDPVGVYAFFRLELHEGGGLPTAEVLDLTAMDKPGDLPAFGTSHQAQRIRRLRRLNGQPAAYEEIWLDRDWAPDLKRGDLSDSMHEVYKTQLGFWIARAEDRIGLGVVPDWGRGLGRAAGTPCGYIERISWDQTGVTCEASRTWFDPDIAAYVSRIR